jgi:hypothetical protein
MGWFFGFKLHLVFNNRNEIVALKLTPGNVHEYAVRNPGRRCVDLTRGLFLAVRT